MFKNKKALIHCIIYMGFILLLSSMPDKGEKVTL